MSEEPSATRLAVGGSYPTAAALQESAKRYLAGGVSSNFRSGGPAPMFYSRAAGSKLYSVDGRAYVDYALGMGPVILGHAPQHVIGRVADCLSLGQLYAGQHERERVLAEMICSAVPCAGRVRFGCSGSEAVHLALRVARAFTRRHKIIKFEGHYHGWFENIFTGVHPGAADYDSALPESGGQPASSLEDTLVLCPGMTSGGSKRLYASRELKLPV